MRLRSAALALCALALSAAAPAGAGDLAGVVYERTLMREAGARCKLFEPRVEAALVAGALQARAAALRAGATDAGLDAAEAQARAKAAAVPCDAPDLRIAAQRVRAAFQGWGTQPTLALPGVRGAWSARRRADRPGPFWALSSSGTLAGRRFTVGLRATGRTGEPLRFDLELADPEAGEAWTARLVVRDPARAPQPYLAPGGRPPPDAERVVGASGKQALDGGRAWRFRFPPSAADALAALDPRENARLELVYAAPGGGDRTVSTLVEAGDFAVGRAFLSAGPSR